MFKRFFKVCQLFFNSYYKGLSWASRETGFICCVSVNYMDWKIYSMEEYKNFVITIVVIFSLLIISVIMLAAYINRISKIKRELQIKNEELTASDDKLKKQLEEHERVQHSLITSEKRYLLLFEKMMNAFFIFEPVFDEKGNISDLRFLKVNPGFELHTGLKGAEIIGKKWMEVYNYPNKNLHIYNRILLTGRPEHFETYYEQEDKYYLTNAFKISGNEVGAIFENITRYKQAIKEITKLNEELEQKVAERTDELQSAVNELEAFTYTVSHDLKSPLRAIEGYSRFVLEDLESGPGEETAEMIHNIRNISLDMIEMINKLLEYSTMTKTEIVEESVDSGELFKSIINELLSVNSDRNIELKVITELPVVSADKVLFRQVLYNILSNAIKFTKFKDQAIIEVGCTINEGEYIFHVGDNGVGFDMEYSGKLFGIFQRLHTKDEFDGSGIGLVTVKKIIQKHGGRVWIKGSMGQGATVYFTLPVERGGIYAADNDCG